MILFKIFKGIWDTGDSPSSASTMVCPPVNGDYPQSPASGLSPIQVDGQS